MEETEEEQALTGEQVRFTVHKKPACVVEFAVEAEAGLARQAREAAIKKVTKEVTFHGFRKGRVPKEVVLKNYAQDVDKIWQDEIANLAFRACAHVARIPMLHTESRVSYKCTSHSEQGAVLTLTFETEPEVPDVDPKSIELKPCPRPEVSDEKIQETMRQMRFFFANWERVEDRPVEMGDFVLIDMHVLEEGEDKPLFSHTRFEVAEKGMAEWMRALLIGMNVGEEKEGTSVPDEDAKPEDKEELKPKRVRIKLIAIERAELPPLDDAFAQRVGIRDVEALQARITELLNTQADAHVREDLRSQINEALVEKYPFELPASLVHKEVLSRLQQLSQTEEMKQYWEKLSEEKRTELLERIRSQAEKAIKLFYLCQKIVRDAKLEVTPSDVPPPSGDFLELLLGMSKRHHHLRNPEGEHAEAYARLVLEKAEDYIIAQSAVA